MTGDAVTGDERAIGYMLIDPNTSEPNWDGVLHDTLRSALDEFTKEGLCSVYTDEHFGPGEALDHRPDDSFLPSYQIVMVASSRELDRAVVRALQDEWDRRFADFTAGSS